MDRDQTPRWNTYSDDKPDPSKEDKPLNRANFFIPHIPEGVLFNDDDEETKDDSSEDSKTKKKKRFTTFFKAIFPNIVERRKGPEQKETILSEDELREAEEDFAAIKEEAKFAKKEKSQGSLSFGQVPYVEASAEDLPAEARDLAAEPQQLSEQTDIQSEQDIKQKTSEEAVNPVQQQLYNETSVSDRGLNTPTEASLPPKTTEIIDKRRSSGAVIAFLAADFFSRRRDKKLARELKKQQRENRQNIRNIREQRQSDIKAQEQTLQIQDRKIESVANEAKQLYRQDIEHQKIDYIPASQINTVLQESRAYKEAVERGVIPKEDNLAAKPEQQIAESIHIEQKKHPKQAERNENIQPSRETPQELTREFIQKNREVPDVISAQEAPSHKEPPNMRIASPNIYSDVIHTQNSSKNEVSTRNISQKSPLFENVKNIAPMYRQSIGYGFGAAVFILVLGLLAYFLR